MILEMLMMSKTRVNLGYKKTPEHSQKQIKKERTNVSKGSLQPEAEGSTAPVPEVGTFKRSVTSHPTISSQYFYSITESK